MALHAVPEGGDECRITLTESLRRYEVVWVKEAAIVKVSAQFQPSLHSGKPFVELPRVFVQSYLNALSRDSGKHCQHFIVCYR